MTARDEAATSRPLPWHETPWRQLLASAEGGRLPHAVLFAGPAGSGCEELAGALARLLLCHAPTAAGNCGGCKGCALAAGGSHGDFLALLPTGKAQGIQVAQVRDAIAFAAMTPSLGRHKVLFISPAERMNSNAANALLKCLEEPSPNTFLLLVTAAESRLPATVRSRCQTLRLPLPAREAALAWLQDRGVADGDARRALALARGRPLEADRLLESGELDALARRTDALAAALAGNGDVTALAGEVTELSPTAFLDWLDAGVHGYLGGLRAEALRSTRSRQLLTFGGELRTAAGAVAGGANPQPELLRQALLARLAEILGEGRADATLPRVFSPVAGP